MEKILKINLTVENKEHKNKVRNITEFSKDVFNNNYKSIKK